MGVTSDGLMTSAHPAASAGNSFHDSRVSGKFHGVIAATTPTGSGTEYARTPGTPEGSPARATTLRAVARAKERWKAGHRRTYRPWITSLMQ
ncbi:hypothetical protein SAMN04487980_1010217 [Streptomyces sp. cf124]|nr:hypothetical protein SAMN04487980_1010217 [Streptomyces sp. cf124]